MAQPSPTPTSAEPADQPDLLDMIAAAASKGPKRSAEEILNDMAAHPFFMTPAATAQATAGGGDLAGAVAALYGADLSDPFDTADALKNEGNIWARADKWAEARGEYTKGISALHPAMHLDRPDQAADEQADARAKKTALMAALHLNRAIAQAALKNYASSAEDAQKAVELVPSVKAYYRLANSHYSLKTAAIDDKHLQQARTAATNGLDRFPGNEQLARLKTDIETAIVNNAKKHRQEQRKKDADDRKQAVLTDALALRNWNRFSTPAKNEIDVPGKLFLAKPTDPTSELFFPILVVYPTDHQSDFLTDISEHTPLEDILHTVLQQHPPWDSDKKYTESSVQCLFDLADKDGRVTAGTAGVVKCKKSMTISAVLAKSVPVRDDMVTMFVVPDAQVPGWVAQMKAMRPA